MDGKLHKTYAKKSYGQHFLLDHSIAESIASEIGVDQQERNVCEVGPGRGFLTEHLLYYALRLTAIEADLDMVGLLKQQYGHKLHLIHEDILKVDFSTLFEGAPFVLVGNFPYNISSQIVFRMLDFFEYIPTMVGMFQKEMAMRITANPGTKEYGIISVMTQTKYSCKKILHVDPSKFNPPPKVQSTVIRLDRKAVILPETLDPLFRTLVKKSFGQRRKMISNSLTGILPRDQAMRLTTASLRPEVLDLDGFVSLYHEVRHFLNK